MPIRLNLLAEAQAAEEARRKDPVRRAIIISILVVAALVGYALWLQSQAILAKRDVASLMAQIQKKSKENNSVLDNQALWSVAQNKLAALRQLSTNRFLYGNLLDTLQRTTVPEVQLISFRGKQDYTYNRLIPESINGVITNKAIASNVVENCEITFRVKVFGEHAEDRFSEFRGNLEAHPFFKSRLGKTNHIVLSQSREPGPLGENSVVYTLLCPFQPIKREN